MRIMVQNKELQEFAEKMEEMLKIKKVKYQDTWKIMPIGELKAKLDKQMENWVIDSIILINSIIPENKEDTKRNLIHIANYCYFLYIRMSE